MGVECRSRNEADLRCKIEALWDKLTDGRDFGETPMRIGYQDLFLGLKVPAPSPLPTLS